MDDHDALLDRPREVRDDDRLDVDAVTTWLADHVDGLQGRPEVRQFPGGASNLTYELRWPGRTLILRRPPFGHKAKSAHDMGREVRVLTALAGHYPVPSVVAWCGDESVADGEFYVMEKLSGVILRQELPKGLGLDAAGTRRLCDAVLEQLVALHSLDVEAADLVHLGKGSGYVQRQIEGWSRRYRGALTPGAADGEEVMAWLAEHLPEQRGVAMIHGDFRFDNVVLDPADPTKVLGVLDWEMATLGDPLMDVGNSLAYWVQADDDPVFQMMRRQPTHAPGMRTRAEVWDFYQQRMGVDVGDTLFYEVYGLFRLQVILQQIWFRVHHGQSSNPAFASFGEVAKYLDGRCRAMLSARA
jgi:aminoglycoside phosphotransferase (APT) family kinase protein